MPHYFLCYRRDDTAGHVGRLYSDLERKLGGDEVFWDQRSIPAGVDHREATKKAIEESSVVLAVIGRAWRPELLQNETDYVRRELEAALGAGKRIVPVLVQGAEIPSAADLPETIRPLHYLNAAELSDRHWDADVRALLKLLRPARSWRNALLAVALLIAIAVGVWVTLNTSTKTVKPTAPSPPRDATVATVSVPTNAQITVKMVGMPRVDSHTLAVVGSDPPKVIKPPTNRLDMDFVIEERVTEAVLSVGASNGGAAAVDVFVDGARKSYQFELPPGTSTRRWVFNRIAKEAPSPEKPLPVVEAGTALRVWVTHDVEGEVECTLSRRDENSGDKSRAVTSWDPAAVRAGVTAHFKQPGEYSLVCQADRDVMLSIAIGARRFSRQITTAPSALRILVRS